jgi:prephenate dehydratase
MDEEDRMETIRKVEYFVTEVSNKPGEAARVLAAVRGVNLLAFTGFPSGRRAQVDFVPEDAFAFKASAKQAKLKIKAKRGGFLIQGDDRSGAVADVMQKLAGAKINVTALDAVTAGNGRWGAIFWVKTKDVNKTAKALGAM